MNAVTEAVPMAWRCGADGCPHRPILGYYTELGGCYVRMRGTLSRVARYTLDLNQSHLDAQCGSCQCWRRLYFDREAGKILDIARPEPWPVLA